MLPFAINSIAWVCVLTGLYAAGLMQALVAEIGLVWIDVLAVAGYWLTIGLYFAFRIRRSRRAAV